MKSYKILLPALFASLSLSGQQMLSPDSMVKVALENNLNLRADRYRADAAFAREGEAYSIGKTNISLMLGQYNSYEKSDNNLTLTQNLPFPLTMVREAQWLDSRTGWEESRFQNGRTSLALRVKQACIELYYLQRKEGLYVRQDSLYQRLEAAAQARYTSGEGSWLELQQARVRRTDFQFRHDQLRQMLWVNYQQVKSLSGITDSFFITAPAEVPPVTDEFRLKANPDWQLQDAQVESASRELQLEKSRLWPDLQFGYFNQTLMGTPVGPEPGAPLAVAGDRFQGFSVGVAIPLWVGPRLARIKSTRLLSESEYYRREQLSRELQAEWNGVYAQLERLRSNLVRFEQESLPVMQRLPELAEIARNKGEISFTEYLFHLQDNLQLSERYLEYQCGFQLTYIRLQYLNGTLLPS